LPEALKQTLGCAQILEDNGARAAIYAARLDEVVVGASVDNLALDTGHGV